MCLVSSAAPASPCRCPRAPACRSTSWQTPAKILHRAMMRGEPILVKPVVIAEPCGVTNNPGHHNMVGRNRNLKVVLHRIEHHTNVPSNVPVPVLNSTNALVRAHCRIIRANLLSRLAHLNNRRLTISTQINSLPSKETYERDCPTGHVAISSTFLARIHRA